MKPKENKTAATKKPKASSAIVLQRVTEITNIRLEGAQLHEVVEYANENGWGVSESQIRKYVRASNKMLAKSMEANRGQLLARHLAQRRTVYAKAMRAGDLGTALKAADSEAKLLKLIEDGRVGSQTAVNLNVAINEADPDARRVELFAIIAALRERQGDGANPPTVDGRVEHSPSTNGRGEKNGHA